MPSFHYGPQGAAHADDQHRQASQPPGAAGQNAQRDGMGVMVPGIHDDVEAKTAVRRNGLILTPGRELGLLASYLTAGRERILAGSFRPCGR